MVVKLIVSSVVLCWAEFLGTFWVWRGAPTDTLRVSYASFWQFESGRLQYWMFVFAATALLWIAIAYRFRHRHSSATNIVGVGLAAASEMLTSVWYWQGGASGPVRSLYESIWYWHRVPQALDIGWPSFRGYLWSHALPWASLLLVALAVWYVSLKVPRARTA